MEAEEEPEEDKIEILERNKLPSFNPETGQPSYVHDISYRKGDIYGRVKVTDENLRTAEGELNTAFIKEKIKKDIAEEEGLKGISF